MDMMFCLAQYVLSGLNDLKKVEHLLKIMNDLVDSRAVKTMKPFLVRVKLFEIIIDKLLVKLQ
jgi:hypothetical protein